MAKTIIHIGMPRTGSTFLQQVVFPNLRGYEFADLQTSHFGKAFQQMQFQDDTLYEVEKVQRELKDLQTKNSIISNENLVGQSLHLASTNRSRNAQRLKELFPEAEIILILRNQTDLLQSLYAISVYGDVSLRPSEFVHFGESAFRESDKYTALYRTYEPVEHAENYLYTPLLQLYQRLFAKVHVMIFENFLTNKEDFIQDLFSIFGEEVPEKAFEEKINRSPGDKQLSKFRRVNQWKPVLGQRIYTAAKRYIEHRTTEGTKFAFEGHLQEKIRSYFREDNHKLIDQFPNLFSEEVQKKYV